MATDKRGGLRKGILVICIVVLISLALASANEFIIEPIAEESQETSANADPANSTDQGLGEENNANNIVILSVPGMGSQHCAGIVETSLLRVGGVSNVKTNVAVKEVEIKFNSSKTNESSLMAAVKNAGYENHVTKESSHEEHELKEIKNLKRRFIISLIFSLLNFSLLTFTKFQLPGIPFLA